MLEESKGDLYQHRLAQVEALERAGINPFPAESFPVSHKNIQLVDGYDALEGQVVCAAGRMVHFRKHGGLTFSVLEDETARIQAMLTKSGFGPELYKLITDNYGVGDFVGVKGILGKTNTGEITIRTIEFKMLAKALRQFPFQILDPEAKQRQRYLETIIDGDARKRFRTRSKIVQKMREYFINELGCLEVETPVLDTTYGGAQARPFTTYHNALGENVFMRISNELYLKRLTVGGFYEGVFEFSRDFRNEGMDRTHNPEFTQVELYKPFWDYKDMMVMAETLISGIAQHIHGKMEVPYGDYVIDYKAPWRRLIIYDGLREKLGIEASEISDDVLRDIAKKHGVEAHTRGDLMLELFEALWEDELIQPTFVLDYPDETSALTKKHREDPSLTERFEIYVAGMEVGNCYSELNDPRDQRKRFETEVEKRKAGDQEAMPFDEDFIIAMEYGMPLQSGIGISVDRFSMLLTNSPHIRDVIYFPTLKPK